MTTATAEEPVAQAAPAEAPATAATPPADAPAAAAPAAAESAPAAAPAAAAYERLGGEQLIAHWGRLVSRTSALLLTPEPEGFVDALTQLDEELLTLIKHDIDRTLVVGMHAAGTTGEDYCAAHSLCVALGAHLAGRVLGTMEDGPLRRLRLAALTMNIGMAQLQDQLALQDGPLTPEQKTEVDAHAAAGAERLTALGVSDADWLEAVRQHHEVAAGAPEGRAMAEQIARLIQRLDLLMAMQSLRAHQDAQASAVAARQIYKDENDQPDSFGAAAIKALGIYPPGTVVRLANAEVAVVLRRGLKANQPLAAAVAHDGDLRRTKKPQLRDTSQAEFAITGGLTHAELNMRLDLAVLLDLTG